VQCRRRLSRIRERYLQTGDNTEAVAHAVATTARVITGATTIRCVLVPASMTLLGKWNWYLPGWLEWLPDPHIERED
jgi:putative drug exporter of the RND superfamily